MALGQDGIDMDQRGNVNTAPEPAGCDDDIVISGMSALMPSCKNLKEFAEKLYGKENLVNNENSRWNYTHPELSHYIGKAPDMQYFDAQFFGIHYRLAHVLDVMTRLLLEQTYQALYDAGINPVELSGKRVGVFIGSSVSETEKTCSNSKIRLGILGGSRAMNSNRISYWLNVKGPSVTVDATCCSSILALEKAYQLMRDGLCDAAIVGGSRALLHPQSYIHYSRLIPANRDGKTKCYDMNADGQSMSDATNIIFLQKYKDAKRVYASVRHVMTSFDVDEKFGEKYGPYRSPSIIVNFLNEFYQTVGISPSLVEYVEGQGAALPETDKSELQAIEEVFCKDRTDSMLVGSVASNIGYTDAASGTSALVKLMLAYQKGEVAASLHCDNPHQDITAVRQGRIRIVADNEKFRRTYTALNQFSLSGVNAHALFQGHYKPRDPLRYKCDLPYLVPLSGRQESSVEKIMDDLKLHPLDPEEIALLHHFYKLSVPGHMGRGFGIYSTVGTETISLSETVEYFDKSRPPLWFVYSGMGSQWTTMGTQLMRIPVFASAIQRCHKVLKPRGVDIVHILTSPDKTVYDNILNSFVGIAAVQIGLTDVLRAIGLVPDKIIGHSVGELGCAYADGCLTAEEMILAAYSRGLVSVQTPFVRGSMAAVGMGYRQIVNICPAEISVACRNGPDSSTISGPAAAMKDFVAKLTEKGIFAKEVPCSNIAYHSKYIANAGPGLLKYLKEVIKVPKQRTDRWVSTSVPMEKWSEPEALYSSAEYHTNNLLSPVLFEETSRLIPANAVVVEIAPHGLLQAILKRSLPVTCRHIPLTRKGHADNILFLFEAIGRIYTEGYDIDVSALYPKVEFPVSTETRHLSHLVDWIHTEEWSLCTYVYTNRKHAATYEQMVTLHEEQYLAGHVIEGTKKYPFSATLVSVWNTLAMSLGKRQNELSVQFHDLHLYDHPPLEEHQPLYLKVSVQKGCGRFEVTHDNIVIAEGYIYTAVEKHYPTLLENDDLELTTSDVYHLLYSRGYDYEDKFRSIQYVNNALTHARVSWQDNWVTFIDGIFQLNCLRQKHNGVSLPKFIKYLSINPRNHFQRLHHGTFNAQINQIQNVTSCGGLLMKHILFKHSAQVFKTQQSPAIKSLRMVPFYHNIEFDMGSALYVFMQMIAENINKTEINVLDVKNDNTSCVLERIEHLLNSPPKIKIELKSISVEDLLSQKNITEMADVIIIHSQELELFKKIYHQRSTELYTISVGASTEHYPGALYWPISRVDNKNTPLELGVLKPRPLLPNNTVFYLRNQSDLDVLRMKCFQLLLNTKLTVLSPYPPPQGLREFVSNFKQNNRQNHIYVAMVNLKESKEQDLEGLQSFKMTFNIWNKGTWCGEYYVPVVNESTEMLMNPSQVEVALESRNPGNLEWIEVPGGLGSGIPVMVQYAALNVYDAKLACGGLHPPGMARCTFGMDFSGITESGERVMGVVESGAASSKVHAHPRLVWPVPAHWTLEEAATVPLPYAVAFYCLVIKCELSPGCTVLIHEGAGALGQAMISIALAYNCNVFTTASDARKIPFLLKLFPQLKENHIGNSGDLSFADMVLNATEGRGCDLVINCLRGQLKNRSFECIAKFGTLLDTDQIQEEENYTFGMYHLVKNLTYIQNDFKSVFDRENLEDIKNIQALVSEGIARGYVRPLTRVTYGTAEGPRALRLLGAGQHRGRVLLQLRDTVPRARLTFTTQPQNSHLLILYDEKDCGLLLADKLVAEGVKKLHLHTSSSSALLDYKRRAWRQDGVEVTVSSEITLKHITYVIKQCRDLGPVEAIYLLGLGLTHERKTNFITYLTTLDLVSRELCPALQYFVVVTQDIVGNHICWDRAQCGLPSLAIQMHNLDHCEDTDKDLDEQEAAVPLLKWRDIVITIEKVLRFQNSVLVLYPKTRNIYNLFGDIANCTGLDMTSDVDDNKALGEHCINTAQLQELSSLVKHYCNIVLLKEELLKMTPHELKALCVRYTSSDKQTLTFEGFFDHVHPEEIIATAEIVLMPTLIHNSEMRNDEFDYDLTYLCVIPGMEGTHTRFDLLCQGLKIPAIVLQLGLENQTESVHETAQRLVYVMMKKLIMKKHFYLLGYEFGVLVALEMARILESCGLTGTVYCLGGLPEGIQAAVEARLGGIDTWKLQNVLIEYIHKLLTGHESENLKSKLLETKSWSDKVDIYINTLQGKARFTHQYKRALVEAAYSRLQLIRQEFVQAPPLRSKLVVLQAQQTAVTEEPTGQYSLQPVVYHQLQTTLVNTTRDLQCTRIINEHLDPELLKAFDTANHCESYLFNRSIVLQYGDTA